MEEIVTFTSGSTESPPDLRLIHYNDVYHVEPSSAEPVGGIARFQTLCNYYKADARFADQPNLITLFSGDAFNPSLESSVTKGTHMVAVLNAIRTDAACVGNHDLDFGIQQFKNLAAKCDFPWLLANVLDPALGENVSLGNVPKTMILNTSNGIKVGLIGLVEREWLATINSLPPNLIYKSASATAIELVPGLREQGADVVIAISHQREPNDNKLAEKTPDGLIDLVLGGHDHYYQHAYINGTHVLRSGSDFKQLSYVEARRRKDGSGKWDWHIVQRDVVSEIPEDATALELASRLTSSLKAKMERPLGYTATPLDARFTTVRLKESNVGNFVCDLMRSHYQADCTIIASGTIRGDQIYPPGVLRVKDIMNCFPFEDPCVVLGIKGKAVLESLENAVSTYPALEGRFPQVSNLEFEFDPRDPPNHRVKYVNLGGQPLDLEKEYSCVTREYMARGKDGFDALLAESEGGVAREIIHGENGVLISTLLRQYFMSLKILGQWKMWGHHMDRHWTGVHEELHDIHPVVEPRPKEEEEEEEVEALPEPITPHDYGRRKSYAVAKETGNTVHVDDLHHESDDDEHVPHHVHHSAAEQKQRELHIARKVIRKWWRLARLPGHPRCIDDMDHEEFTVDWTRAIAPRVEGRIKMTAEIIEPMTS